MARLSIRIDLGQDVRLGPGKVTLLDAIARHGSISAAGRALKMSYKRAWDLVAELNESFGSPVVVAQGGGRQGGGARLTPLGEKIVALYRSVERDAESAVGGHLGALDALVDPQP